MAEQAAPERMAVRVARVRDPLEQAGVDERPQPGGERRSWDVEVADELSETTHAEERLAQDQQGPALADDVERAGDGAARIERPGFDSNVRTQCSTALRNRTAMKT